MKGTTPSCSVEVPIVLVKEYAYCPRIAFYKYFTLHEPPTKSMEYLRYTKLYLAKVLRGHGVEGEIFMERLVRSESLGVYGRVDAVVDEGRRVHVVEVKLCTSKAKLRRSLHLLLQLTAYVVACEETFKKPIGKAMVVVLSTGRVVEVGVTPRLRRMVVDTIKELKRYVEEEKLPPRTPGRAKCYHCFYNKFCA
ncbi:MAG: CRISPR-associated protein Cas4 [Candidatus Nezhaarchaeales archaeon]